MECNGFDSSKFRYFRLKKEDKEYKEYSTSFIVFPYLKENMVFKMSDDSLYENIFSNTFYRCIQKHLENFEVKRLSNENLFDVIEFLTIQDDLVIDADYQTEFSYETGCFCVIDSWLKEKMNDKDLYKLTRFSDPKSLAERNAEVFSYVDDDERLPDDIIKSKALALMKNTDLANSSNAEIYKFKTNTPIHFNLHKGEVLKLSNPVIALALIDQDYLKLLANSEEILGEEKEKYFLSDFKDFIPGTKRKYYKLKDRIRIKDIYDISDPFRFRSFKCNFKNDLVGGYCKVGFCKHNSENFRDDGTIAYFYVDYRAGISDSVVENELLKIADCLSQEDAIIRKNMDVQAIERYNLEQRALEYVKNHKAKYNKGANRLLTPVQFLEQEEEKEKQGLGIRLVKSLNKRINDIK